MATDTFLNITPSTIELISPTSIMCIVENCHSKFLNQSTLQFHLRKHHKLILDAARDPKPMVRYFCPESNCKYNVSIRTSYFASRKYLRQHFLKVHATKEFNCDKCDRKFACKTLCHQHVKTCGFVFKCDICDWSYSSRESLLTHCRRKNHTFPKNLRGTGKVKAVRETMKNTSVSQNDIAIIKSSAAVNTSIGTVPALAKKWIHIVPDPNKAAIATSVNPGELLKSLQRKTSISEPLFKSVKLSKISQMTQTASLYKVNCRKISREVGCLTSPTTLLTNMSCGAPSETIQDAKFKDLELIDEESNTLISNASQTYRNLNHLNYVEDENTLTYFTNAPFNTSLCHIETQTELMPFPDNDNIDCSRDMDPLLYSHMYTQTCDDILSELGLATIHTQTNWPDDDCHDLFVSTETQTCFPEIMMGDCSTQTQAMDTRKMPNKLITEFSFSNQCTQTQQTDYFQLSEENVQ